VALEDLHTALRYSKLDGGSICSDQGAEGFLLKETEPLQKELYAKGQELRNLWSTQNADPAAIKAKQNEISDIRSQLQDKATNLGLEIRKVLTPEQLAQMPAFSQGAGFGPHGMGFGAPMMGPRGCH